MRQDARTHTHTHTHTHTLSLSLSLSPLSPPSPLPPLNCRAAPTSLAPPPSLSCTRPASHVSASHRPAPYQRTARRGNYNGIESVLSKLDTFVAAEILRVAEFRAKDVRKSELLKDESVRIAKTKRVDTISNMQVK